TQCVAFCFQAEDGIREATVTGVQTCALPISREQEADLLVEPREFALGLAGRRRHRAEAAIGILLGLARRQPRVERGERIVEEQRSEERRVGRERRGPGGDGGGYGERCERTGR